jgi:hypothetical protein
MTIVDRSHSLTMEDDDDYRNAMFEMNLHDGRKRIDPWSTSGIPYCKRRRLDPSKEFYSLSSSAPVADDDVKNPNDTPATSNNNIQESLPHHDTRQQVCTLNSSSADDCRALVPLLSRKRPANVESSEVDQHYDSSCGWPPTPHRPRYDSFFPLATWQEEPRRQGWPPLEMKYPLPQQLSSAHVAPPLSSCRDMVVWTPTPPPTAPPPTTSLRLLLPPPATAVPPPQMVSVDDDDVNNRSNPNDGKTRWDDGKDSDDVIMDTSGD